MIIARGAALSAANPDLVFYGVTGGWLRDVSALAFQIWSSSAQVFPATPGDRQAVDLDADRVGLGRYAAAWTVPADIDVGAYEIRWFYKLDASDPEREARVAFDIVAGPVLPSPYYARPSDLVAEGIPSSVTPARQLFTLGVASRLLEQLTGTFFEPRYLETFLDGNDGTVLHLMFAVSALASISMFSVPVLAENVVVYNRHLSGMVSPDDRRNPKLVHKCGRWRSGSANIELAGVFGCLHRGAAPWGDPHPLAVQATKLLALREIDLMADTAARDDTRNRGRIVSESTRDQSVTYASPLASGPIGVGGTGAAAFTGDPEIDSLVSMLRRPAYMVSR